MRPIVFGIASRLLPTTDQRSQNRNHNATATKDKTFLVCADLLSQGLHVGLLFKGFLEVFVETQCFK